jgi:hypothetical protein
MPGFHSGRPPRNKGLRYPADPPTVEEIVAVMRIAGDGLHGRRLRGLVVGRVSRVVVDQRGYLPGVRPTEVVLRARRADP